VSLTDICNFKCVYCVNGDDKAQNSAGTAQIPLSHTELANLVVKLAQKLRIHTVRLTGGEPLLYRDLIPFITILKSSGISSVKMTTNGFLLRQKAKALFAAGISDINVSLDAIDRDIFARAARGDYLQPVLDGITGAIDQGMQVKLNAVIMRNINENQIVPLLEYAMEKKTGLRFLELMRMGHFYSSRFDEFFYPQAEMLEAIGTMYNFTSKPTRKPSATAHYWTLDNGFSFGIIANESEPFCADCDRLRLDNAGNIYGCLSEAKSEEIYPVIDNDQELTERLVQALAHKQPLKFKGSPLQMISIGG
jgi:cyclic pyranopterin phosphate synthase